MKLKVLLVLLSLSQLPVSAQEGERAWDYLLQSVMPTDDEEADDFEAVYDALCDLEQNPVDLNQATRYDLEQVPFLNSQQVEELVAYLYFHKGMTTLNELRMIKSLEPERRQLLEYFVRLGASEPADSFPSLRRLLRYGHHEVMAGGHVPLYERKGDRDGYQGYRYKHWFRYQYTFGDRVKAGILGSQDAGEPFFAGRNRLGYDFYSYYLQVKRLGVLQNAVVGKYRLSAGMGLVLNNSFSLGKQAMLQNQGRSTNVLRPHSSRTSSDYFQGAAATASLFRRLSLTAFVSWCPLDATPGADGVVTSLNKSGYHRTATEMAHKNSVHATAFGAHAGYRRDGFSCGLTGVYTHLDRTLQPRAAAYRRYYASGTGFANASVDYGYTHPRFSLSGETAIDGNGALATINSLSLRVADGLSVMALQRFYSYRYTSLYANAFREGSLVQNESGVYMGAEWRPTPKLRVQAYADYAYFPWYRYQVSQSSHAWDFFGAATYTASAWSLLARYRLHRRQQDGADKSQLQDRNDHRARLSLTCSPGGAVTATTQADFALSDDGQRDFGYMLTEKVAWTCGWLRLNAHLAYFHTDSYASRVYAYEQGPLYTFSIPPYYGEGLRYSLMARAAVGRRLSLTAKVGVTNYFDRSVIGTGYQQIDASSQADLDLQLRWKI